MICEVYTNICSNKNTMKENNKKHKCVCVCTCADMCDPSYSVW